MILTVWRNTLPRQECNSVLLGSLIRRRTKFGFLLSRPLGNLIAVVSRYVVRVILTLGMTCRGEHLITQIKHRPSGTSISSHTSCPINPMFSMTSATVAQKISRSTRIIPTDSRGWKKSIALVSFPVIIEPITSPLPRRPKSLIF